MLLTLGVDASEPREIIELRKDFACIRESRLAVAAVKGKAFAVANGVVVTGLMRALWMAMTGRH